MTNADKGGLQGNLLLLPYRDRQLIAVIAQQESESAFEKVKIKLSDYLFQKPLNPLNILTKEYWDEYRKRMNLLDTKNWGIIRICHR